MDFKLELDQQIQRNDTDHTGLVFGGAQRKKIDLQSKSKAPWTRPRPNAFASSTFRTRRGPEGEGKRLIRSHASRESCRRNDPPDPPCELS